MKNRMFVVAGVLLVLVLSGCGGGGGGGGTATSPDIAVISSSGTDVAVAFGTVMEGANHDEIITVRNDGTGNLEVGTVASANPVAAPFTKRADTCSGQTIAPAGTCAITIRFAPAAAGSFSDTFGIPTNDPDENPRTVTLTGTGSAAPVPNIVVTDSVAPENDHLVSFGTVTVQTTASRTVTVSNDGTANLAIGTVASVNPLAAPFSKTADTCSGQTIAPAASCTVTIRFSPTQTAAAADSLDIPNNDPDTASITVSLTGTGIPAAPTATPAMKVNGSTTAQSLSPRTVYNNTGKGIAVWEVNNGSLMKLLYSYHDGVNWSIPVKLVSNTTQHTPAVASNGTDFMIVWSDVSQSAVRAVSVLSNGTLGTPVSISTGFGYEPSIASNGTGYAAAWYQLDGSWSIFANVHNGTSWAGASVIESGSGSAGAPRVASNGTGYAAAWYQYDGVNYSIYANIYSAGTWTAEQVIDNQNTSAMQPAIAGSSSGYAVAWPQSDGTRDNIHANIYSGSSWTTAHLIETGSGPAANPRIASDGTGYAVAWQQYDGVTYSIYANIYSGTTWTTEATIETGTYMAYNPSIASNGAGGYGVAWQQSEATTVSIYAATYSASSWGAVQLLESGSGNAGDPFIARKEAGYGVVWKQLDQNASKIFVNLYGGTWGSEVVVDSGQSSGAGKNVQAATNRLGTTLAVWEQYDNGLWRVYGSLKSGGTWGAPFAIVTGTSPAVATNGDAFLVAWSDSGGSRVAAAPVSSSGVVGTRDFISSGNGSAVRMASNGSGYAVCWVESSNIYANIYSGSTWTTAKSLETGNFGAYSPQIASDGAGYAVAWHQYDGSVYNIYANLYSGSTWTTAALLESSNHGAVNPRIASNGSGYAVAWQQSDGPAESMYAALFNGTTWAAPALLENGSDPVDSAEIASNGTGYAVVWRQFDTAYSTYVALYNGSTWASAAELDSGTEPNDSPAIASDGTGYAVAWRQGGENPPRHVRANKYNGTSWTGDALIESSNVDTVLDSISVISNGNGYSALWTQMDDADPDVSDIWGRTGL